MPRQGKRGLNFHDARGSLTRAYSFAELREDALAAARRLITLGIKPGDRVALVAETGPEFATTFFGAVYAGAWPVPLPLPTSFGGRGAYVEQLAIQLKSSRSGAVALSPGACRFLRRRCRSGRHRLTVMGHARQHRAGSGELPSAEPDDIAYLQYSSGSTRFPHGVAVTHRALLDNLHSHGFGLKVSIATALFPGCPGTTTWAWSAVSYRRSRCRCRSIS